ncbi:MAG: DUF1858 domain-containing protein [Firmicutes bacterium]|nr:DUF1858 domain-containing protein [Bacillota bacterium]
MINKDMIIKDLVDKYPMSIRVFAKHGLHCIGCGGALFESVEQGAKMHGINVDALMEDLKYLEESKKQ